MKRLKDYYLSILSESEENFDYITTDVVGDIIDIDFDKGEDFFKIRFKTTYGKEMDLLVKYSEFKKWFISNLEKNHPNFYHKFLTDFISSSQPSGDNKMNEIIDDDGNIMPSTDMPNNSTNTMVGSKLTWDLEKVYKSNVPRSIRFYSGDLGIGIITW
jgi:hypothetical protein